MVDVHFYLDSVRIFHCMDMLTRFSAAFVVKLAYLDEEVFGFEVCWIYQFWHPTSINGDSAFESGSFSVYMKNRKINFRLVPKRRHRKKPLEIKHGVIQGIFLRLKNASPDENARTISLRAVSISNDLYGSYVTSSFELSKDFTKPIDTNYVFEIPADVVDDNQKLQAKRKLSFILKSKPTSKINFAVGDVIEVFSNKV